MIRHQDTMVDLHVSSWFSFRHHHKSWCTFIMTVHHCSVMASSSCDAHTTGPPMFPQSSASNLVRRIDNHAQCQHAQQIHYRTYWQSFLGHWSKGFSFWFYWTSSWRMTVSSCKGYGRSIIVYVIDSCWHCLSCLVLQKGLSFLL